MKLLLLGAEGSIGRRYKAIFNNYDYNYAPYDITTHKDKVEKYIQDKEITHILIATPTRTHLNYLWLINDLRPDVKVLCEKPITTDVKGLEEFLKECHLDLTMVCNYAYVEDLECTSLSDTSYNFYNSGNDGLAWDCIQLIALAKGDISLSTQSPIWGAEINGYRVYKEGIDFSYCKMLEIWMSGRKLPKLFSDKEKLLEVHKKTHKLQGMVKDHGKYQSSNWDSSENP